MGADPSAHIGQEDVAAALADERRQEPVHECDEQEHALKAALVNRAFTPKVLARIEGPVRARARRLAKDMVASHPDGRCDLVTEFAGPLPLQIICDMMGIPEEDHQKVFHWTTVLMSVGDEDVTAEYDEFARVTGEIADYGVALAEDRRAKPRDDLTTKMVLAEVDGERLTSAEIASFFILLTAAGNETTRNAISHGMLALTRYPDERKK